MLLTSSRLSFLLSTPIISLKPKVLILFEINELALYLIDSELNNINSHHSFKIYPVLGSVNNKSPIGSTNMPKKRYKRATPNIIE